MGIVRGYHVEVPTVDENAKKIDVDFSLFEVLLKGAELVDQEQLFLIQENNFKDGGRNYE